MWHPDFYEQLSLSQEQLEIHLFLLEFIYFFYIKKISELFQLVSRNFLEHEAFFIKPTESSKNLVHRVVGKKTMEINLHKLSNCPIDQAITRVYIHCNHIFDGGFQCQFIEQSLRFRSFEKFNSFQNILIFTYSHSLN